MTTSSATAAPSKTHSPGVLGRWVWRQLALIVCSLGIVVAHAAPLPATGWVSQVGTYDRLAQPDYSPLVKLTKVSEGMTMGLGTFGGLDGELVMLDGVAWRVSTSGRPHVAHRDRRTPFFEGIDFRPTAVVDIPEGTACSALTPLIDRAAGTTDGFVAVEVAGLFTDLTTRSVPRQSKPFPPLADVVAQQVVFPLGTAEARLVGFRGGNNVLGIGQSGLHLHGLTVDLQAGGHVLSCVTGPGVTLAVQRTRGLRVLAP